MKKVVAAAILLFVAVGALVTAVYSGSTILDNPGVTLPPALAEKSNYDQEAVALNDQAMELVFKDPKRALSLLDQAIAKDATNPMPHSNRATLLLQEGNFVEASKSLERVCELQPDNANAYITWAFCLHRLDNPHESQRKLRFAIAACNAELKEANDDQWPRIHRALAVYLLGEAKLAIRELDVVMKTDYADKMIEGLRDEMRTLAKEDAWKILHLN